MPKALKEKLKRQGRKKGYTGERLDKYVYGTMATIEKKTKKSPKKKSAPPRKRKRAIKK